jgi:hypothetical protein
MPHSPWPRRAVDVDVSWPLREIAVLAEAAAVVCWQPLPWPSTAPEPLGEATFNSDESYRRYNCVLTLSGSNWLATRCRFADQLFRPGERSEIGRAMSSIKAPELHAVSSILQSSKWAPNFAGREHADAFGFCSNPHRRRLGLGSAVVEGGAAKREGVRR